MKTCIKCQTRPQVDNSYCLECKRLYERERYAANREHTIGRKKNSRVKRASKIKQFVYDMKSKTPCFDCGKCYPHYVMHFDHRDPSTKLHNISNLLQGSVSMEVLLAEIEKCDIVCANCHAERTHQRGHYTQRAEEHPIQLRYRNRAIQDQNGTVYSSQRAAAIALGITPGGISKVICGKRKSYKGFVFSLVNTPR